MVSSRQRCLLPPLLDRLPGSRDSAPSSPDGSSRFSRRESFAFRFRGWTSVEGLQKKSILQRPGKMVARVAVSPKLRSSCPLRTHPKGRQSLRAQRGSRFLAIWIRGRRSLSRRSLRGCELRVNASVTTDRNQSRTPGQYLRAPQGHPFQGRLCKYPRRTSAVVVLPVCLIQIITWMRNIGSVTNVTQPLSGGMELRQMNSVFAVLCQMKLTRPLGIPRGGLNPVSD
jgi:hypothetical protein